ncbi:MAG: restriction endonuclease, partial [Lentisphaeria bacterium]|nr:restriction endonuclease [Lentisphaeria bacterium]
MNTEVAKSIIAEYKKAFRRIDSEERYKWEAIKCFQDNWNPDAENFEEMLEAATAKAKNLLDSISVFPRGMILEYARKFPEETRQWFTALFDE